MRLSSLTAAAAGAALALTALAASAAQPPAAVASPATPGAKDVIVHLFQWPWASVASECTNVLGPKGFGARPGLAAAGARGAARPRLPVVAGLPAGQLPADHPPR